MKEETATATNRRPWSRWEQGNEVLVKAKEREQVQLSCKGLRSWLFGCARRLFEPTIHLFVLEELEVSDTWRTHHLAYEKWMVMIIIVEPSCHGHKRLHRPGYYCHSASFLHRHPKGASDILIRERNAQRNLSGVSA